MIQKMTLKDDVQCISEIIYQTDDFIFPFLFGKLPLGTKRLEKLLLQKYNSFSYQRVYLEFNSEIRGILIEHDTRDKNHDFIAFLHAFGMFGLLCLALRTLLLFPLTRRKVKNGRYIQCVCVKPTFRGIGIGSKLLMDAFYRAKNDSTKYIILDVDSKNTNARALYERFGFVEKQTRHAWFMRKKQVRMIKLPPYDIP